jgi:hypothetical protein
MKISSVNTNGKKRCNLQLSKAMATSKHLEPTRFGDEVFMETISSPLFHPSGGGMRATGSLSVGPHVLFVPRE